MAVLFVLSVILEMGSSIRKKKEKQKDFEKPKFKVGKKKPKPSNFTDTSFKSKGKRYDNMMR